MAFQSIDTGYKPEFGLGALYQGFNAANADEESQLDIIKNFLANQREQQMQPIDMAQAQQNLDAGKYKTSPEYQTGMTNTIFGQGKSNLAAGQTAEALQPFKQKAQQAELEQQSGQLRNLAQIQQIDDALNDNEATFQPGVREQFLGVRRNLVKRFKETPEFAGKRELGEMKLDSAEYIAEEKRKWELEKEQLRQNMKAEQALTIDKLVAKNAQQLFPNDPNAQAEYVKSFKQETNPSMGDLSINPTTKKLTTKKENVSGTQQAPALPSGWTMK